MQCSSPRLHRLGMSVLALAQMDADCLLLRCTVLRHSQARLNRHRHKTRPPRHPEESKQSNPSGIHSQCFKVCLLTAQLPQFHPPPTCNKGGVTHSQQSFIRTRQGPRSKQATSFNPLKRLCTALFPANCRPRPQRGPISTHTTSPFRIGFRPGLGPDGWTWDSVSRSG